MFKHWQIFIWNYTFRTLTRPFYYKVMDMSGSKSHHRSSGSMFKIVITDCKRLLLKDYFDILGKYNHIFLLLCLFSLTFLTKSQEFKHFYCTFSFPYISADERKCYLWFSFNNSFLCYRTTFCYISNIKCEEVEGLFMLLTLYFDVKRLKLLVPLFICKIQCLLKDAALRIWFLCKFLIFSGSFFILVAPLRTMWSNNADVTSPSHLS